MIERLKDTLASSSVHIGAPLAGGGFGIIAICEKIAPVLTVLSLITGIVIGILSCIWKRKLINKQIDEINQHKQ